MRSIAGVLNDTYQIICLAVSRAYGCRSNRNVFCGPAERQKIQFIIVPG